MFSVVEKFPLCQVPFKTSFRHQIVPFNMSFRYVQFPFNTGMTYIFKECTEANLLNRCTDTPHAKQ